MMIPVALLCPLGSLDPPARGGDLAGASTPSPARATGLNACSPELETSRALYAPAGLLHVLLGAVCAQRPCRSLMEAVGISRALRRRRVPEGLKACSPMLETSLYASASFLRALLEARFCYDLLKLAAIPRRRRLREWPKASSPRRTEHQYTHVEL